MVGTSALYKEAISARRRKQRLSGTIKKNVISKTGLIEQRAVQTGKNLFDEHINPYQVYVTSETKRYGYKFDKLTAGTYTFSFSGDSISTLYWKKIINGTYGAVSYVYTGFTTTINTGDILLIYSPTASEFATRTNYQLEKNTIATSYEPYIPYSQNPGIEILSVPSVTDTYVDATKVYTRNVGKLVLQESDIDYLVTTTVNVDRAHIARPADAKLYTVDTQVNILDTQKIAYADRDNTENVGKYYVTEAIYFIITKGTTLEQAKALLAGKVMYYQLATPLTYTLPCPEYPLEILNNLSAGTYKITLPDGLFEVSLPHDLRGIGEVHDILAFNKINKACWIDEKIGFISSYAGETINTAYMSTTGALTTGASVAYVLPTPTQTALTVTSVSSSTAPELPFSDYGVMDITNSMVVGSTTVSEQCVSGSNLDIGSVYMSEMKIEVAADPDNAYDFDGALIEPKFGIKLSDGAWEDVPLGRFWVSDDGIKKKTASVSLTANDGMVKLDTDLTGVITEGIPQALVTSLCLRAGVTLGTDTTEFEAFANALTSLKIPVESSIETCRDLLMWVCSATATFARFNRSGQLELVPVKSRTAVRTINKADRTACSVSDKYFKVTQLKARSPGIAYSVGIAGITMELSENPLLTEKTPSEMTAILNAILAEVTTVEYTPCTITGIGDPSLQAGDFINIALNGSIVTSYLTHSTWKFRGSHTLKSVGQSAVLKSKYSQSEKSTNAIKKTLVKTKQLAEAVNHQTELLNTAIHGFVYKRENELFIMDTADPTLATKIWRWNINGLGYSDTEGCVGVDDADRTYTVAITMDGWIKGMFIEANSILSNSISQSYKAEVSSEIGTATVALEQIFNTANGQLQSFISDVSTTLTDETETRETAISNLQQTVNSLSLGFTNSYTGGKNAVRNSAGLNGLSDEWIVSGSVETTQNDDTKNKTASNSCFKLNADATLSQTIEDFKFNQPYTLTVLVKKTSAAAAYIKLFHDGNEALVFSSEDAISEWTEYSATIGGASGNISIEINSTGDSFYVSDIILAEGTAKCRWTPAPDEIYTTNVKFDRHGITVSNKDTMQKTVMTPEEFAGYYDKIKSFYLNKDEFHAPKTVVDTTLTVGNLRFIPMDNPSDGLYIVLLD